MKVIVTGSKGQVGTELCKKGKTRGFKIIPLDLPDFDISDQMAVENQVVNNDVNMVVNAAAYTAVDRAESESDIAFAVNQKGPENLALSCKTAGIPLIHISTDYVFDGSKKGYYIESDTISPLGVYGTSKAAGENEVRTILNEHIILRTAWLCSEHGNNFVKTMIRLGQEKDEIRVVSDQYGSPTFASDISDAILDIAAQINERSKIPWGTYHYCGKGVTTWYAFAKLIFKLAGEYTALKVERIIPVTTQEYPTPAKRPANSALDCSLLAQKFGIYTKAWQVGLENLICSLLDHSADE
jgi:dTDP-4-dehydrorhamnose reductase